MADYIGNIEVPEIASSGVFPLTSDLGHGQEIAPKIVTHVFRSGNSKISQRFLIGPTTRRFKFLRASLKESERHALQVFWENMSASYGSFTYRAPSAPGTTSAYSTSDVTCTFEQPRLLGAYVDSKSSSVSLTMVEVPTTFPTYTLSGTVTRFPTSSLATQLLQPYQIVVPMLTIRPKKAGYPVIYLSDRRFTLQSGQDATVYQPRLLSFSGIKQSLGSEADMAKFTLGNADRVFSKLTSDVNLDYATVEFALLVVSGSNGTKLNIWKGELADWDLDLAASTFSISAVDGVYELTLAYPVNQILSTCQKSFNSSLCPFSTVGQLANSRTVQLSNGQSTTYSFTPSAASCDFGFTTPNGCMAHTMDSYFNGVILDTQGIVTRDNANKRRPLSTTSVISASAYEKVLKKIFTDEEIPVPVDIFAMRDEGDFFTAIGIIGSTIKTFGSSAQQNQGHLLDGMRWHGYPKNNYGLRRGCGHDPAIPNDPDPDSDKFSLGEGGAGIQRYNPNRAAGVSFIEMRISDSPGLQLTRLTDHKMQASVLEGAEGWIWTAAGSRSKDVLTNPVWISVNALLEARGVQEESAAVCEEYFDVDGCIAAAAICDLAITSPFNLPKQFKYIGMVEEQRPLKDWLQDFLMNCLGNYVFTYGKFKPIIRSNSSVSPAGAFTEGNIIDGSLRLSKVKARFNHLTVKFGNTAIGQVEDGVPVFSKEHAEYISSRANAPTWLKGTLPLSGCNLRERGGLIGATRLKEELGGVNSEQFAYARNVELDTTILSLGVEAGMVCSVSHPDCPDYPASDPSNTVDPQAARSNYLEFRCEEWELFDDMRVTLRGKTTHNDIYSLVAGPKPADQEPEPLPEEIQQAPADWGFDVATDGQGSLLLKDFSCATNALAVERGVFDVFYINESAEPFRSITADVGVADKTINFYGPSPEVGKYLLMEQEVMLVESVNLDPGGMSGTMTVARAQQGTSAATHVRKLSTVTGGSGAVLSIGTGLNILPGHQLVNSVTADQRTIASYDNTTGEITTLLPFEDTPGDVFVDPRFYCLQMKTVSVPFQQRFFKSGARASFIFTDMLPWAGVVVVNGLLRNTRGLWSDEVRKTFVGTAARRLRTGGPEGYQAVHPSLPSGAVIGVFDPLRVDTSHAFDKAYVTRAMPGDSGPLEIPAAAPSSARMTGQAVGSITLAGALTAKSFIRVEIGELGSDKIRVEVPTFETTDQTTLAQVATALASWMNENEEFSSFFYAVASGSQVSLFEKALNLGVLTVNTAGSVTATATGMTSPLSVGTGRRYAVTFRSSDGLESEPGPLSASSGPSGGASGFTVIGLPGSSADPRVTTVAIWATRDGLESPLKLLGTVSLGFKEFVDTTAEASLPSLATYTGATHPAGSAGALTVTVNKDGEPWVQFSVEADQGKSREVNGLALGFVSTGQELTANTDAVDAAQSVRVIFE